MSLHWQKSSVKVERNSIFYIEKVSLTGYRVEGFTHKSKKRTIPGLFIRVCRIVLLMLIYLMTPTGFEPVLPP